MKTKIRAVVALATLLMATPFFGVVADTTTKPHKVVLKNIIFDSVDTTAKTIAAHDESTNYTINVNKAKIQRSSGEKATLSGILEFFEGDPITVWGKTTDGININATKVKNNNTRKIKGLYLATIVAIVPADTDFPEGIQGILLMIKKDNQISEVLTYGYTKFWFGKKRTTFADLKEGDVVSIQGILRTYEGYDIIYNTTRVRVRNHGPAPSPSVLDGSFRVRH